ncbi:MAG: ABC transporter substrate-binding protein [Candidatus Nanopelagicales bacterium]
MNKRSPFARRFAVLTALLALVAAAVLTGCSSNSQANVANETSQVPVPVLVDNPQPKLPVTVTDVNNDEVTVKDTSRIVSLGGGISETLIAMGLGDKIVGRDVSSEVDELEGVTVVTNGHDISAEGVLKLNPTVVIGDSRSGPPEALDALRKAGVPVVIVPEVWSLSEYEPRVQAIAHTVGMPDAAKVVTDHMNQGIEQAKAKTANHAKCTANPNDPMTIAFLYLRGTASVYLLGGKKSGADDLIASLGAQDAGTKAGLETFTPLTPESLAKGQPDVILVMEKGLESVGGVDGLVAMPGVGQTPAGQNKRVIAMPDSELLSFGPRTPATLERIADKLNGICS